MIAYLLTASLISTAMADDPDTPDEETTETTNTTDASNTTEESSTVDTLEVDRNGEVQNPDQSEEFGSEIEELSENDDSSTQSEEGTTIETVIEMDVRIETDSDNTEGEEDTTEIEQMMSEIMEEMANSEENTLELGLEIEVDEEDDEFNYKGNIEYSYVLTMWDSPERHIFHVGQFSGDPQYYFQQSNDWGYTAGIRFQLTGSETLSQRYDHTILGVTGGLQYTSFRINTSVSWTWEQYFAQTQTDKADGFVTYQYDELVPMSGILWENTLTYSPEDMDFGVQTAVGFPFQVTGDRDMGQAFNDSWQVSTRLNISLFQLGYTHLVYPGHSIDRIQIGSGILF